MAHLLLSGVLAATAGEASAGPAATMPTRAKRAASAAPRKRDAWPGSQEGLVFLWHSAWYTNQITDRGGKVIRTCRVEARGRAVFGRFHDMDLAGGFFLAEGADKALLSACRRTGQLAVEALITPDAAAPPRPAAIVSFGSDANSRNFTLAQRGEKLILRLRTPDNGPGGTKVQPELCRLTAGKPHHVIVTYRPGRTVCYLNGRQVADTAAVRGDFSNWAPQRLLFGDELRGGCDWAGRLEGVAVYSRFVGADEAKRKYDLYRRRLAKRKDAVRLVVLGECIEATATPTLKSIRPYRRCLAVYTYAVRKVLRGDCRERKILVAHWVILDRKVLGLKRQVGRTYRLTVEAMKDHPQLDAERVVMEQDELDLPRYYDVGPRGK